MKVIFLDMDGVLCTYRSCCVQRGLMQVLDPVGIQMLGILLRDSGAQLVLSSTWRFHNDKHSMTAILQNAGLYDVPWHPVWATPAKMDRMSRGQEIQEWLDENGGDLTSYLILDDDRAILEHQKPFWIETSMLDGISFMGFDRAKKILGILDEE